MCELMMRYILLWVVRGKVAGPRHRRRLLLLLRNTPNVTNLGLKMLLRLMLLRNLLSLYGGLVH